MKKIIYFGYYLKILDWKKFRKFLVFTREKTGIKVILLLWDILRSSFRYNISILEYFQFRFFELDDFERKKWAGMGYMYEYQKLMNPPEYRNILEDKTSFFREYRPYMKHIVADIHELEIRPELAEQVLNNKSGKVVFKIKNGGCGKRLMVKQASEFESKDLIPFMLANQYDLLEEFIVQNPVLNLLAPNAVNTIRVFTQLDKDDNVKVLGSRLRISISGYIDNLAAGNIAATIDDETGIVIGPGVYSDITKIDTEVHPVTETVISGIQIPFWKETIQLATSAALLNTKNRSVGWDIAITPEGPDLIEGNREWCRLLYQLPIKKGLKSTLDFYLNEYKESSKATVTKRLNSTDRS